ncbi:hypothetical protein Taro_025023 [Colocasia esculenta]|uniref:Uncharacterized protein n=1 Tax=Colocasia esculenta TaxID=4460 RepID=A0A843V7T6_COLES|nr:hypothetical protein [Colocasia esculenta]
MQRLEEDVLHESKSLDRPPRSQAFLPCLAMKFGCLGSIQPSVVPVPVHAPATTDSGEPAAFFSLEEVNISCKLLDLAIIAKTPQCRPPFQDIRADQHSKTFVPSMTFHYSTPPVYGLIILALSADREPWTKKNLWHRVPSRIIPSFQLLPRPQHSGLLNPQQKKGPSAVLVAEATTAAKGPFGCM